MTEKYINRIISVLYRYNQRFFSQKLAEHSLPLEVGQIPTLMQVYKHPGITQEGISANAGIDKGTVAHVLKQLEKAGMVDRQTDTEDRRINHIFATDKGLECKEHIFQIIHELHQVLYQDFQEAEIQVAMSILERMKTNMKDYMKV